MTTLILLQVENFVAELALAPAGQDWLPSQLVLSHGASRASFDLVSAPVLPAGLLAAGPGPRRTLARSQDVSMELSARLRDWLHQAGQLTLDVSANAGAWFFGCTPFAAGSVQGAIRALANLDFSAWLAPHDDGVEYAMRVKVTVAAAADVAVRATVAGQALSLLGRWRMAAVFEMSDADTLDASFDLDLPLPGLRLPRIAFPTLSLSGFQLRWPAWSPPTMLCPEWLRDWVDDFKIVAVGAGTPVLDGTGGRLTLTARIDELQLIHQPNPPASLRLLTAYNVELELNADVGGGTFRTEVRCRSIEAPGASLGAGAFPALFGLPFGVRWQDLIVTPSVVFAGPQAQLRFRFDVLGLSVALIEDPDTFLTLDLLGLEIAEGSLVTSPRIRVTEGGVSQDVSIEIRELVQSTGQALKGVYDVALRAVASATKAFAALLRWFASLFSALSLPSTGPANIAWPAIGNWLRGLARDLSIQLVVDTANRRMLRIVISGRDAPRTGHTRRLLDAFGFTLDADYQNDAQLALVVETAGPQAGDWFVIVVPPAGTGANWLKVSLATDLWLARGEGTELAQDADPSSGKPAATPALNIVWEYPASSALMVAGVQHHTPRFFRQFVADAGKELIALEPTGSIPQIRIHDATGPYQLAALDLSGTISVAFDQSRVLPFLRKFKKDGDAPGFADRLQQYLTFKVVSQTLSGHKITITGRLTLHLAGDGGTGGGTTLGADVTGAFDLDTLKLRFDTDAVEFKTIENQIDLPSLLGLHWHFKRPSTSSPGPWTLFRLSLDDEPVLSLGEGVVLTLRYGDLDADRPLVFEVERFALSRGGISLDAMAKNDAPIRLGGIDTYFQFNQAQLRLRDSQLEDFQLAGTGSLPPALVGDAKVNASLHFGMRDGKVAVRKAYAQLDKSGDPIECKALRFQFLITALGFDFAYDAEKKYHFYFLLSGSAEFKPEGGEFKDGLLQHLRNVKIELNQCPLTSDPSVLAQHLTFTIATPQPKAINFFNLFKFEIRSIGFEPASRAFNGAPALKIGGQIDFAEIGDIVDPDISFHALYIGPPKSGESLPQIRCDGLRLRLRIASKVRVGGALAAVDGDLPTLFRPVRLPEGLSARGFIGDGELEIPGLPGFAASFGFMEITNAEGERYRAWFVYLQANKLTYHIKAPIPLFIRELGFGFGYRYTLVGIKAAEEASSPKALIEALDDVSKRQGDLARFEAWEPEFGSQPKFTLALRGLVAMASASPDGQHKWDAKAEANLPSPLSMDLVAALRSDFTFLMNVRVWLAVNYSDFLNGNDSLRHHPLVTGYLYLSAPRQEFLARLVSHQDAYIGKHPIVPDLVQRALRNSRFSATLLMRPGLLHFELGWPNQLSWQDRFGPLDVRCVGGFVFRVEDSQLLLGMNFGAAGRLELQAEAGSSSFGASVSAVANVAFVARIIAVIDARRVQGSMYYGLVAIDLNVAFRVRAWMSFKIFGRRISISIGFSFALQISVALELVLTGDPAVAGRARAYVAIRAFGRTLGLRVNLAYNADKVDAARARVARYLDIGLAGPAKLPPDPFSAGVAALSPVASVPVADAAKALGAEVPVNTAAVAGLARALAPSSPRFGAWCVAPRELPQSLDPAGYALLFLIPEQNDFYGRAGTTYTLTGLPEGTLRFDTTPAALGWLPIHGGTATVISRFDAAFPCEGGSALTLAEYLLQTYREEGDPNPVPREWKSRTRLDGLDADQRGRRLHDAERAIPSADVDDWAIHDARDFLLSQFLDDIKQYASHPTQFGQRMHALQMGLGFLVPVSQLDQVALTIKCSGFAEATSVELLNPPDQKWFRARPPRFSHLEARNEQDRVLFAWDLQWRSNATDSAEPEEFLFAYEVRRRIDGSDLVEAVWEVLPCDAAGGSADGNRWERFRNVHQFSDDFADPGLDESLRRELRDRTRAHTLRYDITPICQALTRGPTAHVVVERPQHRVVPAPHAANVTWRWRWRSVPAQVQLAGATLSSQWQTQTLEKHFLSVPSTLAARVVLRAEAIDVGGSYGTDAELQTREALGKDSTSERADDWTGALSLVRDSAPTGVPPVWPSELSYVSDLSQIMVERKGEAPKTLRAVLEGGAGRVGWRVFVQLVDKDGGKDNAQRVGNLLEATHEMRADGDGKAFCVPREFEWPVPIGSLTPEAKVAARVGAVSQLQPRDDLQRIEDPQAGWHLSPAAPDLGVLYQLQWPLWQTAQGAPAAAFALQVLELDEIPPRLLAPSRALRADAHRRRRDLEQVTVQHPQRAALLPEHNREGAQWDTVYPTTRQSASTEAAGPARRATVLTTSKVPGALQWPTRTPSLVLGLVPDSLLDYLEQADPRAGEPHWPQSIRLRLLRGDTVEGTLELLDPRAAWLTPTQASDGQLVLSTEALGTPTPSSRARLRSALASLASSLPTAALTLARSDYVLQILAIPAGSSSVDFGTAEMLPLAQRSRLHPLLQWVATAIHAPQPRLGKRDANVTPWRRLEFQANPVEPSDGVSSWMLSHPEGSDPFGWSALRDLGLGMTLRVFDRAHDDYLDAQQLIRAVNEAIGALRDIPEFANSDARYLFVDVLLRPQQLHHPCAFEEASQADAPAVKDLGLAMIQISLRPAWNPELTCSANELKLDPTCTSAKKGLASFREAIDRLGWTIGDELAESLASFASRFQTYGRASIGIPDGQTLPYAVAAPRGSNPAVASPNADGVITYAWRDKDRYGHQRAFRAVPIGRYDAMLEQLFPAADGAALHTLIEPAWQALDTPRSEPVTAPAVLQSRWLSIPRANERPVPMWQVVVGRHAEQALSEANLVVRSRLRFAGMAHALVRQPADVEWAHRISTEQAVMITCPEVPPHVVTHADFEKDWSTRPLTASDWGELQGILWRGAQVLRFPALPYCYRHDLALTARAGLGVSSIQIASAPSQDVDMPLATESVRPKPEPHPSEAGAGAWVIRTAPTRYRDGIDPLTFSTWEPADNLSPLVRDLPDPDVAYQLDLVTSGTREPIAHLVRNRRPHASSPESYVSLPLGRRFDAVVVLKKRGANEQSNTLPLELKVALRRLHRAVIPAAPIGELPAHMHVEQDAASHRHGLIVAGGLTELHWKRVVDAFSLAYRDAIEQALGELAGPWTLDIQAPRLAAARSLPAWLLPVADWKLTIAADFDQGQWQALRQRWQREVGWRSAPVRRVLGDTPPIPAPTEYFSRNVLAVDFDIEPVPMTGLQVTRAVQTDHFRVLSFLDDAKRQSLVDQFGAEVANELFARFDRRAIGVGGTPVYELRRFRGALPALTGELA